MPHLAHNAPLFHVITWLTEILNEIINYARVSEPGFLHVSYLLVEIINFLFYIGRKLSTYLLVENYHLYERNVL